MERARTTERARVQTLLKIDPAHSQEFYSLSLKSFATPTSDSSGFGGSCEASEDARGSSSFSSISYQGFVHTNKINN